MEALLPAALNSPDEQVRETAQALLDHRERVGVVLAYDENAVDGFTLAHPQLGR